MAQWRCRHGNEVPGRAGLCGICEAEASDEVNRQYRKRRLEEFTKAAMLGTLAGRGGAIPCEDVASYAIGCARATIAALDAEEGKSE